MRYQVMATMFTVVVAGSATAQQRNRAIHLDPEVLAQRAAVLSSRQGQLAGQIARVEAPRVSAAPPQAWATDDPADSLYQAARGALNRRNYTQAAYLFSQIYAQHPKSTYTPDAYYWEAYARYLNGSSENLDKARDLLAKQERSFPEAKTRDDAEDLIARINTRLARGGDEEATARVIAKATAAGESRGGTDRTVSTSINRATSTGRNSASGRRGRDKCRDDDDDDKMAALNALLQMDADRALPILTKVMARRDEESVCLRRKGVFLISQQGGEGAESMLLAAVRQDPDGEVRQQAVFWLGQSGGKHAAAALDSILRASTDREVQDKAIFALSQQGSPMAMQSLRDFAMKKSAPSELRQQAIFWIGQTDGADNVKWLKSIYQTVDDEELKDKIIFSVSQGGSREAKVWLMDIAANQAEDIEIRKKALFWLGQASGTSLPELFGLYERFTDRPMREQLIFVYSQRDEKAAVDKLVSIAKTEKDRELRKKALFWLSQSNDPRVVEILEDILTKP